MSCVLMPAPVSPTSTGVCVCVCVCCVAARWLLLLLCVVSLLVLAAERKVDIRSYDVIYRLLEDVEDILSSELAPTMQEGVVGTAEVRQVFERSSRGEAFAGCVVTNGELNRNVSYRLLRNGRVVADVPGLDSLKHFQDDVRAAKKGMECGVALKGWNDYQQGDKIEAYEMKKVPRRIQSAIDTKSSKRK